MADRGAYTPECVPVSAKKKGVRDLSNAPRQESHPAAVSYLIPRLLKLRHVSEVPRVRPVLAHLSAVASPMLSRREVRRGAFVIPNETCLF